MIPTIKTNRHASGFYSMFQSRNRETYDSNSPTRCNRPSHHPMFQSRNRETYDSNFTLCDRHRVNIVVSIS